MSRTAVAGALAAFALAAVVGSAAAQPHTITTTTLLQVAFTSPSHGVGLFERSTIPHSGTRGERCAFFTRTTGDGGAEFGAAGAAIRGISCALAGASVAADGAGDLFVYDGELFESHDAGASWHAVALGGAIVALSPAGRSVWALRATGCHVGVKTCTVTLTLLVSANGGRSWRAAASQPPARRVFVQGDLPSATWLVRTSASAAAIVLPPARASAHAIIEQTLDGGARWTRRPAPCVAGPFVVDYAVAPTGALWIACAGQPGAGQQVKTVARSLDGGRSWVSSGSHCRLGTRCDQGMPLAGYLGGLAAVSADSAFYVGARSSLVATRDGGRSWTAEPGFSGDASGTAEVTFVSAGDGWAIDYGFGGHAVLWRTRDGGRHWTPLATP